MTIDEMDAMDDDRCDGCDGAIDDTSRFLITQQVMLPFWSWRLHILATFTNLISRQNICTNAWSVMGLELPKATHRRSPKDRGDELDERADPFSLV